MIAKKPKILITTGYYLPGFKSGGPLRSLVNLIDCLSGEFDFYILTSNMDMGEIRSYPNLKYGVWMSVGNAKVRYLTRKERGLTELCTIINKFNPDLLYLNSFFGSWYTVFPLLCRYFGILNKVPILLAPRGEFSAAALSNKCIRKSIYLYISRSIGLFNSVCWQASTKQEAFDINRIMGKKMNHVYIASDLPNAPIDKLMPGARDNDSDFHIIFLSRIARIKNLHYALDVLLLVNYPVVFNIFGPIEDQVYWRICLNKIAQLPRNIKVQIYGAIHPSEVPLVMRNNDLMFLPTCGENYGHVISEALSVGTQVLISDQTPWRNLSESQYGFDLPLDDPSSFVNCINLMLEEIPSKRLSRRITRHAAFIKLQADSLHVQDNRDMIHKMIGY